MAELNELLALRAELEKENDEVQRAIEDLIAEMERVPPEQRSDTDWGPNGVLTKRYLELSERQGELVHEMKLVTDALAKAQPKSDAPKSVH